MGTAGGGQLCPRPIDSSQIGAYPMRRWVGEEERRAWVGCVEERSPGRPAALCLKGLAR